MSLQLPFQPSSGQVKAAAKGAKRGSCTALAVTRQSPSLPLAQPLFTLLCPLHLSLGSQPSTPGIKQVKNAMDHTLPLFYLL